MHLVRPVLHTLCLYIQEKPQEEKPIQCIIAYIRVYANMCTEKIAFCLMSLMLVQILLFRNHNKTSNNNHNSHIILYDCCDCYY